MDFGNGFKIGPFNVLSVDPKLLNFVLELRAYLHAHEFAKARLGNQIQRFALFSLFAGEYYNGDCLNFKNKYSKLSKVR